MPIVVTGIMQDVHMREAEDADDKKPEQGDEAELGCARPGGYDADR